MTILVLYVVLVGSGKVFKSYFLFGQDKQLEVHDVRFICNKVTTTCNLVKDGDIN